MTSIEGPVIGWLLTKLGPVGRWLNRQVRPDHRPITGRQRSPVHQYYSFCLFVAVAPSDSAGHRLPVDFMSAAHDIVADQLADLFTESADYSGPDLVRYCQPVPGLANASSWISFYPTGLIELMWNLAVPPSTTLPLDETLSVLGRLHDVVRSEAYRSVHRHRRFERWRRLDWRIGVNALAVSHDQGGSIWWTDLATSTALPTKRMTDPRPSCGPDGYGSRSLNGVSCNAPLPVILQPFLEELLAAAGYTNSDDIRRCANDITAGV
ncbi:hypothetical protein [Amycolatopsis orientalis]|uniref:hypothetical protein n=1 Tax=Amycolatopsis orientalis TaxID=31958 RepID=UPI001319CC2C|nr:hypothetical protein [Amycolatopsis orientalis]